ncbi:MAG: glycoside hydrolase N-terminal domain-containing protein [Clostridia bacterium]|nr:glycoside hydrolase N-terminal domain-containing protein [Clostridia bacterium]
MKLKKIIKGACLASLLAALAFGLAFFAARILESRRSGTFDDLPQGTQKSFATTFTTVKKKPKTKTAGRAWRDGFIGGDGKCGFVTCGAPYDDTLMMQNVDYIMPSPRDRDDLPDQSAALEQARQAIVNFDDSYEVADCGEWNWGYAFHPGQTLRLTQKKQRFWDYVRWTDFETGEVGVKYCDKFGTHTRTSFTSRKDHVTITAIRASDLQSPVSLTLSVDAPSDAYKFGNGDEKNMKWKILAAENGESLCFAAHYPAYDGSPLKNGGYAGVTYILTEGGEKKREGDTIVISGAQNVYLFSKNDRTSDLCGTENADCGLGAFEKATSFALTDRLLSDCKAVAARYTQNGAFDYAAALAPSAKVQKALFESAALTLTDDEAAIKSSNEALLLAQKKSNTLYLPLLQQFWQQARFAMICASGYSMTRLSGMWTGEWMPGWRSEYTMDANVNLQTSGMNTANLPLFGEGYIKFILRQLDDWKRNAEASYGFSDTIKAPVNADGDGALDAEYAQSYPFQYWNAGASWVIQPIYEYWKCFGNRAFVDDDGREKRVLEDVLLPLLQLEAHFWEQFCTPEYYTDKDGNARYEQGKTALRAGERYLLVPSYSPENTTGGAYQSTLGANAAIDIGAAKSALEMAIDVEESTKTDGWKTRVQRWTLLRDQLPPYRFDESGAIKEWCANGFDDNNRHRHISHLYCAWPLMETHHNEALAKAALTAIDNREKENSASHGFVHQALVLARLKQGERAEELLLGLLKSRLCYHSLMTDHNTNRGSDTYCTDALFGCMGIVNELLLCSDEGEIELLPAKPAGWHRGSVQNLAARTGATVSLQWEDGSVSAEITSQKAQRITVSCAGKDAKTLTFSAGETQRVTFE